MERKREMQKENTCQSQAQLCENDFQVLEIFSSSWFSPALNSHCPHKTRKDLGGVPRLILQDEMLADTNIREKELNFVLF